jgi:hypothetical protein
MPWGASKYHFVPGVTLDRDHIVNTWWAKVNNYEFIKELNYINSTSNEQYIYTRNFEIGKYFEIMLILEHYKKWLNTNPCPVRLLAVGDGKYTYQTEILALTKSQLIMTSGSQVPLNLLNQYKYEYSEELSRFCYEWGIEEESSELYTVLI